MPPSFHISKSAFARPLSYPPFLANKSLPGARNRFKEGGRVQKYTLLTNILQGWRSLSIGLCQPRLRPDVQTHRWPIPRSYLPLEVPTENNA